MPTIEDLYRKISETDQMKAEFDAMAEKLADLAIDNMSKALELATTFHGSIPKHMVPNARVDELLRNFENSINSRSLNTSSYNKPIKKWLSKEEKRAKFWEFMNTNKKGVTRKQLEEFFNLGWGSLKETVDSAVQSGKIVQEIADFGDGRGKQPFVYKIA